MQLNFSLRLSRLTKTNNKMAKELKTNTRLNVTVEITQSINITKIKYLTCITPLRDTVKHINIKDIAVKPQNNNH